MHLKHYCIIGIVVMCYAFYSLFSHKTVPSASHPSMPVEVITVTKSTVPFTLEIAGMTEASETVTVESLVTGQIKKIHFKEGSYVKANDPLFQIDDRTFQYQLETAKANLIKDKAQLSTAEKDVVRYQELYKIKAVSEEQYQQMVTNRNVLKATVEADEAAIRTASLQISYSKITAPIDGVAGEILLHEGNLVEAESTSTPMIVINKLSPLNIRFNVSEEHLHAIRTSQDQNILKASIKLPSSKEMIDASVDFIDNSVDTTTGSIKIKASIPNKDHRVWAGQFVKVLLQIYTKEDAIVIPIKALQNNQNGTYVFVVNASQESEVRPVTVDFSDETNAVIASGLKEGEVVVLTGQLRLSPGVKVTTYSPSQAQPQGDKS